MPSHTEIPNTTQELCALIENMPEEGLHIRQLSRVNDLAGGFSTVLGMRFTEVTTERVAAEMHVTHEHLQAAGIVNGGVFCAIAETVGSLMGIVAARGTLVMGVNNNTDFIAPVGAGVISAKAKVVQAGRRTQLIQIEMFHRDHLAARATLRTMLVEQV